MVSLDPGTTVWRLYRGPRVIAERRSDHVFHPPPPSPVDRGWWDYVYEAQDQAARDDEQALVRRRRRQFWTWFVIMFVVMFFVALFSS